MAVHLISGAFIQNFTVLQMLVKNRNTVRLLSHRPHVPVYSNSYLWPRLELTADELVLKIRNVKYRHFLESPQPLKHLTDGRSSQSQERHRAKRSALFSTGVKVCPQESLAEVITSHKAYYKLRVCQEAVWEAFRIFLDRVPDTMEYQEWVYACQRDSLCMEDLARKFTSTQEHLDMVASKVAAQDEQYRTLTPEPGTKCSKSPPELFITDSDSETGAPDAVPQRTVEHIVKFSVAIVDPIYSTLQRDPVSIQNEDSSSNLHNKMLHALDKLPGFKEIHMSGFQNGNAEASFSVVFETNGTADTSSPDEYGVKGLLKDMVVTALIEDISLPVHVDSISFEPDSSKRRSSTEIKNESTFISRENTSQTDLEITSEPSLSSGIYFGGADPENSFMQTLLDMSSSVTTLPEATEEIGSTSLEDSQAGSLIREDPSMSEGFLSTIVMPFKDQEDTSNQIDATPATFNLESLEAEQLPSSAQPEMDFDLTSESIPPETSSILTSLSPKKLAHDGIFQEGGTIDPSQPLESTTEGLFIYPSSPGDRPALPTSIDLSDYTEAPSVIATIDTLHQKVSPVGPATPEPILSAAIPTEDLISHLTPDNFQDEAGQTLWTASTLSHDGSDNERDTREDLEQADEEDERLKVGSEFPSEIDESPPSSARPLGYISTPSMLASSQTKELVVFFSLRVTNMMFSDDLFNKSSPEYKSLENTFLELRQFSEPSHTANPEASSRGTEREQKTLASIPLLPYLQSNLTGFKELEILNFKNGSVVVNSKLTLNKTVPYNVTETVQCVLEDFCNAASKRLNMEIDSQSVDVEADHADPCKFMSCNEFSRCVVDTLTAEAECLCDPGYSTLDGNLCASICDLEPEYCLNDGLCEVIPGHGATCRCPVGKFWHFHGERCNELISVPVDPLLFLACLLGSLSVVCGVIGTFIFINKKCIRTRKTMNLMHSQSAFPFGNTMRINPVFENDDGVLTHVSSILCPMSSDSASLQQSRHGTFRSIESLQLSIEIPRQLYTRRSEKLMSEMVDFHQYIPHSEIRRMSSKNSGCFLRSPDSEGFDVTVL